MSVSHAMVTATLEARGYVVHRFMLTPLQFGLPNERVRCYVVAVRGHALPPCTPIAVDRHVVYVMMCLC